LLAEMKEEQKLFSRQVEEMGSSLSSLLDELSIHLERADSLARYLREDSEAMSEGIGEVVQAMQFHDITRQQLEAVAKTPQEIGDLDRLLSEETGLHVQVADDPLTCVARGGGKALELIDQHGSDFFAPE